MEELKKYATMDEILVNFSHIRLATQDDNQDILNFYNNESMQTGGESISFARTPDFFEFYKLSSKKYWLFLFLNKDQSIGGVGGVLRHERYVDGKLRPLAYFCDLRISPKASRIAKLQWRKFFPEIINLLPKLGPDEYCETAYTAILADNEAAINSLTKGGRGITYRFLGKYKVHSYVSTGLLKSKRFYPKEISESEFLNFYEEQTQGQFLVERPRDTISKVRQHSTELPYIGIYSHSSLVAVVKPILRNKTRRIKVQNLSKSKSVITKGLKLIGRPAPTSSGELSNLDLAYLTYKTNLDVTDKEGVIEAIQLWIDKNKLMKDIHIINLTETTHQLTSSPIQRGIDFSTPGHLYEIHPEGEAGLLPETNFRFEGSFL